MRFKFIASESHIGEVRLCTYGQTVDLDAEMAHTCILGRVGLLPVDQFDSIGFTEDELERHADYAQHRHENIDPVFAAKKQKSHAMFVKYMQDYTMAVAKGDTFMTREAAAAAAANVSKEDNFHSTYSPVNYEAPVIHDDH